MVPWNDSIWVYGKNSALKKVHRYDKTEIINILVTGHVLPAIRIEVASLSKIILFALRNMFHCRTKFNWFPSFQDHTVTCLWSSANATNSEFCEMAQHKIRKFSFGGCGTSDTSCLGNGSGMEWIVLFSTSYLKKSKFNTYSCF